GTARGEDIIADRLGGQNRWPLTLENLYQRAGKLIVSSRAPRRRDRRTGLLAACAPARSASSTTAWTGSPSSAVRRSPRRASCAAESSPTSETRTPFASAALKKAA